MNLSDNISYPERLEQSILRNTLECKHFRQHIRHYNNALALLLNFASFGAKFDALFDGEDLSLFVYVDKCIIMFILYISMKMMLENMVNQGARERSEGKYLYLVSRVDRMNVVPYSFLRFVT